MAGEAESIPATNAPPPPPQPPPQPGLSYDESELRARALVAALRRLPLAYEPPLQERLARALILLDDLRIPADRGFLFAKVELAIDQLSRTPPNLVLCDRLLDHLEARGRLRGLGLRRLLVVTSPHVVVAAGAFVALLISFLLVYVLLPLLPREDLLILQRVTEAGFVGALTSLMLRFHRMRVNTSLSSRDVFFEGLFRPFIGVFFAWMIYYLLDAELLPLRAAPGVAKTHLYAGLAFVTGFSERLAAGVATSLVAKVSGGPDHDLGGDLGGDPNRGPR